MRGCKIIVQAQGEFQIANGGLQRYPATAMDQLAATQIRLVSVSIGGLDDCWLRQFAVRIVQCKLDFQCISNCLSDFILYRENIDNLTVISIRPEVKAIISLDELRCNSEFGAGLTHAALEHVGDV